MSTVERTDDHTIISSYDQHCKTLLKLTTTTVNKFGYRTPSFKRVRDKFFSHFSCLRLEYCGCGGGFVSSGFSENKVLWGLLSLAGSQNLP